METNSVNDPGTEGVVQQPVQFLPINRAESPPQSRRRRASQSCEPCRKRKSRCVPDKPDQRQPCRRCVTDGLTCDFRSKRSGSKRSVLRSSVTERDTGVGAVPTPVFASPSIPREQSKDDQRQASPKSTPARSSRQDASYRPDNAIFEASSVSRQIASSTPVDPSPCASEPTARSRIISSHLHNTADALDLLTFTAASERNRNTQNQDETSGNGVNNLASSHHVPLARTAPSSYEERRAPLSAAWERFIMIKRQILTKTEVLEYLDFYFNTIWSLRPIIPPFFRDTARYISLATDEPMLLVGLVTLASRYHPLSGSHGEIRSERIHWQAWNLFKKYLQSALWGSPQTRTPGAISAMLLLVEWHPKSINNTTAFDEENSDLFGSDDARAGAGAHDAGSQPLTALTSQQRYGMATLLEELNIVAPGYRSNKMSWILLSTAIALAQEGCCFDQDTQGPSSSTTTWTSDRDKDSLRQQWNQLICVFLYLTDEHLAMRLGLSPLLPESATEAVRNRISTTFASILPDGALWESYYELYSETKKARALFHSLKKAGWPAVANMDILPDLEHLERALGRWKRHHSSLDLTAPKLAGVCLDIEYHYSVLYSFGPANCALRNKTAVQLPEQTIVGLTRISNLAYQASHQMLCVVVNDLAASDLMKWLPVRCWLFIVAANLHLLKTTLTENPHAAESDDNILLLRASIKAIRGGSPDDTHMAVRYARFLEILLNASMRSSRGQTPTGEGSQEQVGGLSTEAGDVDFDCSNLLLPASSWDNMTMPDLPYALGNPGEPFQWWDSTFGMTGTMGFQ